MSYEEGKRFADEWNMPFVEVSALTGVNVERAFRECLIDLKDNKGNHRSRGVQTPKRDQDVVTIHGCDCLIL